MSETQDKLQRLHDAIERKRAIAAKKGRSEQAPIEQEPKRTEPPVRKASKPVAGEWSASETEPTLPPIHIPNTKNLKGRSNKLPNGLTVKQEAFARMCAVGRNQSDAYREAYDTDALPETIHANASRLASDSKVAKRIADIQGQLERDKQRVALRDRERWFKRAWSEAEGVARDDTGNETPVLTTPASRVAALNLLGKALRTTENVPDEQDTRDASTIAEEIANRLHALRSGAPLELETDSEDDV